LQKQVVPKAGLEPARPLRRGILNPLRLPFRHLGAVNSLAKLFGSVHTSKCCSLKKTDLPGS
jgi:hypothetical protein